MNGRTLTQRSDPTFSTITSLAPPLKRLSEQTPVSSPRHEIFSPETLKPEERGLRLIQLLLSCAVSVSTGNINSADHCLRQIVPLASVSGDSIQRLAARFAEALAVRLIKVWPGVHKALGRAQPAPEPIHAREIFARAFPYLRFAYTLVNQTILRAMSSERVIHIVDVGAIDPALWSPFLCAMARVPEGPPHLKITGINPNREALERMGSKLAKEAEVLDIPFQFHQVCVPLRELNLEMLKIKTGEALAICSILQLHVLLAEEHLRDSVKIGTQSPITLGEVLEKDRIDCHVQLCEQMNKFLTMIRSLSPKVFLVVEQESNHNSIGFMDRFFEVLYYYSAIFDSIEVASLTSLERLAIEEMFGSQIENIVACEGAQREERHEMMAQWMVRFGRAGFRPVHLWLNATGEAKQLVQSYLCEGYQIVNKRGCLMICWQERPLYTVSAWRC